jgi:hypothetical protein
MRNREIGEIGEMRNREIAGDAGIDEFLSSSSLISLASLLPLLSLTSNTEGL